MTDEKILRAVKVMLTFQQCQIGKIVESLRRSEIIDHSGLRELQQYQNTINNIAKDVLVMDLERYLP